MAYDLHIKRPGENPIGLSEWRAAIEATEGEIYDLQTGEVVDV